jgi:prepilin peptidase CpaA
MVGIISLGLYAMALAIAAVSDLLRYEIPDSASLVLVAAFILIAPTLPLGTAAAHVATGIAVFGIAALFFAAGLWGGGDVKLLGATALWMGWSTLPLFLILTALAGGALAAALLIARWVAARRTAPKTGRWYSRLLSETEGVPYGVAIAAAGLTLLSYLNRAVVMPPGLG